MPPPSNEYTLLCEDCGYPIEGLPVSGNCPECGRLIASSLPGARPGSDWQIAPSMRSWWTTSLAVLRSPWREMGSIRIETDRSMSFMARSTLVAGFLIVAPLLFLFVAAATHARRPGEVTVIAAGEITVIAAIAVCASIPLSLTCSLALMALSGIEHAGMRLLGRLRGWRATDEVASAVCNHASVGWVVGGVLWLMGVVLVVSVALDPPHSLTTWIVGAPFVGLLIGLLTFETLVYIGIRRCRFANRSRPDPAPAPPRRADPPAPSA